MRRRGRSQGWTASTLVGAALLVAAVAVAIVAIALTVRHSGGDVAEPPAPAGALEPNATVSYVVDGDTVDLVIDGDEERVRLIGINTPESVDRDRPIECYGPEASAYLKSLLPVGTAVRIERDVEPRDDYGRLLGYVHRAADGLFVNLELVWQGYATPLTIEPNTSHAGEIVGAATAAQRAGRGLWGACDG